MGEYSYFISCVSNISQTVNIYKCGISNNKKRLILINFNSVHQQVFCAIALWVVYIIITRTFGVFWSVFVYAHLLKYSRRNVSQSIYHWESYSQPSTYKGILFKGRYKTIVKMIYFHLENHLYIHYSSTILGVSF